MAYVCFSASVLFLGAYREVETRTNMERSFYMIEADLKSSHQVTDRLKEEIATLRMEKDGGTLLLSQLEEKYRIASESAVAISKELSDQLLATQQSTLVVGNENQMLKGQLQGLKEETEARQRRMSDEMGKLREEKDDFSSQKSKLETELLRREAEAARAAAAHAEAVNELVARNRSLQGESLESSKNEARLQEEMVKLKARFDKTVTEGEHYQKIIEEHKVQQQRDKADADFKADQFRDETTALTQQLAAASTELRELKLLHEEQRTSVDRVAKLEKDILGYEAALKESRERVEDLTTALDCAAAKCRGLEEENARLKNVHVDIEKEGLTTFTDTRLAVPLLGTATRGNKDTSMVLENGDVNPTTETSALLRRFTDAGADPEVEIGESSRRSADVLEQLEACRAELEAERRLVSGLQVALQRAEEVQKQHEEACPREEVHVLQESLKEAKRSQVEVQKWAKELVGQLETAHSQLKLAVERVQSEKLTQCQEKQELQVLLNSFENTVKEVEGRLSQEVPPVHWGQAWHLLPEYQVAALLSKKISDLEARYEAASKNAQENEKKMSKAHYLKREAELALEKERDLVHQLREDVISYKAHLKMAKKRVKDFEKDPAELRVSRLELGHTHEKENLEHQITLLNNQLRNLQDQLRRKEELQLKMDQENHSLRLEQSRLKSEASNLRTRSGTFCVTQTDDVRADSWKQDFMAVAQQELSQAFSTFNSRLEDQAAARERLEKERDANEQALRQDFLQNKKQLMEETYRLRTALAQKTRECELLRSDRHRFQDEYNSECQRQYEGTSPKLPVNSAVQNNSNLFSNLASRTSATTHPWQSSPRLASSPLDRLPHWLSSPVLNREDAVPQAASNGDNKVVDAASQRLVLKNKLDLAIAKYISSGPAADISIPPRMSVDDSVLDISLRKSSAAYLETLQKCFFV